MKYFLSFAVALTLAASPAFAQTTTSITPVPAMGNGSTSNVAPAAKAAASPGAMAAGHSKCPSGDPAVAVNETTKQYWSSGQVKAKYGSMSKEQRQAAMKANNIHWMCKSKAMQMGAKPVAGAM